MRKEILIAFCVLIALSIPVWAENESIFSEWNNQTFTFTSGVGGWSTDLQIAPDGTFTGEYHNSDLGDAEDAYPNGTVYLCAFSGQMRVVDENTLAVAQLTAEPMEEYIDDGIRYIPDKPAGINEGDRFLIHRLGTPAESLSEDMRFWAHLIDSAESSEYLDEWFLENENGESGFIAYTTFLSIANPWQEDLTADELHNLSGLSFNTPEWAENIIYRYLPDEHMAEMQFTIDADEYCARIKPADALKEDQAEDISGMYYGWINVIPITIHGNAGTLGQAQISSTDWAELCLWRTDDLIYSLTVYIDGDPDGLDLTAIAEQI